MNDNGDVLFEILLLSDKLLVLSNMEIAFAADNTAVKEKYCWSKYTPKYLIKTFYVEAEVSFIFKERFISCCREPH